MKLRDIVGLLDYSELQKVKTDLEQGGVTLKQHISGRLSTITDDQTACAVCGGQLSSDLPQVITLAFGPADFRKKASFCARDCLDYFIDSINTGGCNGLQRDDKYI